MSNQVQVKPERIGIVVPKTRLQMRVMHVIQRRIGSLISKHMWHGYLIVEMPAWPHDRGCWWCKLHGQQHFREQDYLLEWDQRYALVNVWGTVHDVPCCPKCFEKHNGVSRDEI